MNKRQFTSIAIVTSSLVSIFILAGCSSERKDISAPPEVVRNVAVISARRATVPDYLEAVGTVRASQSSQIASQMMGNILEVRVHEGDRVSRGQVLAVIDDAQPRAGLDQATAAQTAAQQEITASESDSHLAETTLKRYQDLYEKKSVSPQEFDEVKARFQGAQAHLDMSRASQVQAQAALARARTSLEYSRVRAPFDGVVTAKQVDTGTLTSPGMPLFTLEDPRRYRLEATVDEGDIASVRIGQTIAARIDALDAELAGRVAQIVPAADSATRSFLIKIDLPTDQRLRSGLFGRARILRGEKTNILVPRSAIVSRGQLQAVYVLDPVQIAALRYVTLGNIVSDQVEVLSGLDGDERLIAAPGHQELGGKKIEAKP
jgi:RND family efflux transporter MFP subunit